MIEFISALEKITNDSLIRFSTNQTPSNEIRKINMFGLIKLLETAMGNSFRIEIVWEYLIEHFKFLTTQLPIKILSIRAISFLIIGIFNYRKTAPSVIEWQVTVLNPLYELTQSEDTEVINEMIANLLTIIENCSSLINDKGWNLCLNIMSKVITAGNAEDNVVEKVFKCIQYTCNNLLNVVNESNIELLISIVCSLTLLNNTSLPIISLFELIVEHISTTPHNDHTLIHLLSKVKEIGSNEKAQLRQVAYTLLEKVVVKHVDNVTIVVWNYVINDLIEQLLQYTRTKYSIQVKKNSSDKFKPIKEAVNIWEDSMISLCSITLSILQQLNNIPEYFTLLNLIELKN